MDRIIGQSIQMKRRKTVSRNRKLARGKAGRRKIGSLRASGAEDQSRSETGSYQSRQKLNKKRITLFLDADVLAWFKEDGRGYQTRINDVLRDVVREEKESDS